MHLLAAQPGGFVDDEGIVDLAQDPADIIIMSAADSSLAALAFAVRELIAESSTPGLPSIRLANWMQLVKPAALDLYRDKTLDRAKLVVVSLLGGCSYWPYGVEQLVEWQAARPDRHLIVIPGDDADDPELRQISSVDQAIQQQVWQYFRQGGEHNHRHCLRFLVDGYFDLDIPWLPPRILPNCVLYAPAIDQPTDQSTAALTSSGSVSVDDWQQRWASQPLNHKDLAPCAVLFYRSHLQSNNTAMFDELIKQLQMQGLKPLPIAINSLKDPDSLALCNHILQQANVGLILNTTGFASNKVDCPELSSQPSQFVSPFDINIPVLQLILSSSTEEDWQQQYQGLRARDLAMQVVLPEMDGRIITRAVSFKTQADWCEAAQIAVVRYQLHTERGQFVAALAKNYLALSGKPNPTKRLALILANYPTKDGRIGNGVGLDTPATTLAILRALEQEGYHVQDIPNSGTQLIEQLLETITNNPNTLNYLPCWQSLDVNDYWRYFRELPEVSQKQVIDRWGAPEDDPKYRQGRLMLAGMRLGQTFVGIQPARGFNIDLSANYHDPDLVPPHSYLAFYFWLRHQYQVDGVIHIGKHGNLEWLPGKGAALSDTCWPDIALGPIPHFYPFIVNDPGEGAQAKRRAHAVIIDHLMPPMTRAETYGELAQLEALVDEYYQAMGLDERRSHWLRQQIISLVEEHHILEELGLANNQATDVDQDADAAQETYRETGQEDNQNENNHVSHEEAVLNRLDAYLCDIKEAQIRHGLHILGSLPSDGKLVDTLIALLRLPRGDQPEEQGLLHNISADLNLQQQGELFDPLLDISSTESADVYQWQGPSPVWPPAFLQEAQALDIEASPGCRTRSQVRDWLENIAQRLVSIVVLDKSWTEILQTANLQPSPFNSATSSVTNSVTERQQLLEQLQVVLPKTCCQLQYARTVVLNALQQSAQQEIQSIVQGLNGQFVEPGPSGAPTRGRLDTLPTGRNFFAVDNRSIPSQAAWAIGQASANALIERHLQEHGDYPKQLGLSVWGTATMRTGGDDIAQAFALMGVKPIWAAGSQRVIDIEVIPAALLGRPRVDVTLRVSGFFRDAFPNVMRLYDSAVSTLASYDDPAQLNTIRHHINQRKQSLLEQGYTEQDAQRQASYRVFGSKPGAYGAGLQGLIDERCWENDGDLAEAYLNWGGYAYGNDSHSRDGIAAMDSFKDRLINLDTVVQNQDNREHDLLDSDDYYQFQGGMTNAVRVFSGQQPEVYHADHANPAQPKIRTLKEELNRVVRSRVLNPKWIEAMREHGYKGAFEMAASVDYLFAYDATTQLVDDYQYQQVTDALIFDDQNQEFLRQNNINALEEMAERLWEAIQRGLWNQPAQYADKIQDLLLELDESKEI